MTPKSPIEQARELLTDHTNFASLQVLLEIQALIEYAESLERRVKEAEDRLSGLTRDIDGNIYPRIKDQMELSVEDEPGKGAGIKLW